MTGVFIPARTEAEWLEARRQGITASEIAAVMGLSPASQDGPYALYHRKTGTLPPIEDNDAMERGRVLEPYIAEKFARWRYPDFWWTVTAGRCTRIRTGRGRWPPPIGWCGNEQLDVLALTAISRRRPGRRAGNQVGCLIR